MAFEYGEQRNDQGVIIRHGCWGISSAPRDSLPFMIENFRALKDDSIVKPGTHSHTAVARLASTENISDLKGLPVIDETQTLEGDLVLLKDQSDTTKNGLYYVRAKKWERTPALALINVVAEGVENRGTICFLLTPDPIEVGETHLEYGPWIDPGTGLNITPNHVIYILDTGVAPGTYTKVTTNAQGQITDAENPTTLDGYGITDAYTKSEVDKKNADLNSDLLAHENDKNNPHGVFPGQIGAETPQGAQDKADAALQASKDYTDVHKNDKNNPHSVFPGQIGAETPQGAQDKADASLSSGKEYTNTKAQELTAAIATLKKTVMDYTDTAIQNLLSGAPEALDTLNELSNALGNDPNFAATVMAEIGKKLASAEVVTAPTAGKVLRLDSNGKLPADITGDAATVNGHTVGTSVPPNAVFSDTTYNHPDSGVVAGTYHSVTVDVKGHVTAGSNPTTLAGYGITDAAPKIHGKHVPDIAVPDDTLFLRSDNTWQKVPGGGGIGSGSIVISEDAPNGDANVLWIKPSEKTGHFWNGSAWVAMVGTYADVV